MIDGHAHSYSYPHPDTLQYVVLMLTAFDTLTVIPFVCLFWLVLAWFGMATLFTLTLLFLPCFCSLSTYLLSGKLEQRWKSWLGLIQRFRDSEEFPAFLFTVKDFSFSFDDVG